MGHALEATSAVTLRGHVERLTAYGPRHHDNPKAVASALDYISQCLFRYGYAVDNERYGAARHEVNLITALAGPVDRPVLEVGAHWDSVADSPGADDNASGVAGLLELTRIFAAEAQTRALRFCFFGGEEGQPGLVGSSAHVARLDATGARVRAAIVLEMIGYRDTRPGSQRLPADIAVPPGTQDQVDRGDFIAAVGNVDVADYLTAIWSAGQDLDPPLAVVAVSLPSDHSGNGARSDHYPYWLSGRKAVMVGDTAEFRNIHYHRPTDTIDTLAFDFAAQVTQAVATAIRTLTA